MEGLIRFQDIVQSDSNKNSMELAQKKAYRSMNKLDLNVHASDKNHLIPFWNKDAENTHRKKSSIFTKWYWKTECLHTEPFN